MQEKNPKNYHASLFYKEKGGNEMTNSPYTRSASNKNEDILARVQNCPMRHENGNCMPLGGFCQGIHSPEICKAMHDAYNIGAKKAIQQQRTQK